MSASKGLNDKKSQWISMFLMLKSRGFASCLQTGVVPRLYIGMTQWQLFVAQLGDKMVLQQTGVAERGKLVIKLQ